MNFLSFEDSTLRKQNQTQELELGACIKTLKIDIVI